MWEDLRNPFQKVNSQFILCKMFLKNNKGGIELDQLGKLIIALVLLIVLIVIVTVVIQGELDSQAVGISDAFKIFG